MIIKINTSLEIFLNEILGYSGIFTSPTTPCRNKLYITLLEVSLSKLLIAAKCSKKKMPILDDYIDIIYNVDKSFGMFIHADNNSELYFNKSIEEYIKKVDSNSIFNSLIFFVLESDIDEIIEIKKSN